MIAPESTMESVMREYPGARRALFQKYHIGGCASCGFNPAETLQQLCARNGGIDPLEVIAHIAASHEADMAMVIEPAALAAEPSAKIMDIRSREEHEAVKIPGSIFLSEISMRDLMAQHPREALLVFYDHTGATSLDAAAYFAGHGFRNARSLRGGIDAWSLEVDPSLPRYQVQQ